MERYESGQSADKGRTSKSVPDSAKSSELWKLIDESSRQRNHYLAMASLILIFISFGLLFYNHLRATDTGIASHFSKCRVITGKAQVVHLSDGSRILLNPESSLQVPDGFSPHNRKIFLNEGEAIFHIERNSDCPFIVYSGNLKVTLSGGTFRFRAYSWQNKESVRVKRGVVFVSSDRKLLIKPIHEGQQLTFYKLAGRAALNDAEYSMKGGREDIGINARPFSAADKRVMAGEMLVSGDR